MVEYLSPPYGPLGTGGIVFSPPYGPLSYVTPPVARLGTLGCGIYEVLIEPVGGGNPLVAPAWNALAWQKSYQAQGTASVTINGLFPGCSECDDIMQLEPWEAELVVYRDDAELWRGPLSAPKWTGSTVVLNAYGPSGWLGKRALPTDQTPSQPTELVSLLGAIVSACMGADNPMGLGLDQRGVSGLLGAPSLTQYMTGMEALSSLTQAGLAWTEDERTLISGAANLYGDEVVARLATSDFTSAPEVSKDGDSQANDIVVIPANSSAPYLYVGRASNVPKGVTRRTRVVASTTATNKASADAEAEWRLAACQLAPRRISAGTLTQSAPVTIDQLKPGSLFDISVEDCMPVLETLRLTSIQGAAGASSGVASESVTITLSETTDA